MPRPNGYQHTEETKQKISDSNREYNRAHPERYHSKHDHLLTKEFLEREYTEYKKPIRQIAKEVGLSHGIVRSYLIKHNIPRRARNPYRDEGHSRNYFNRVAYITLKLPKICSICGSTEQIHIHHKDKNHKNNSPDNLVIVCNSCHQKHYHPEILADARDTWRLWREMRESRYNVW